MLQKDVKSNLMVDNIYTCYTLTHTNTYVPMLKCMCIGPQHDYRSIPLLAFDGGNTRNGVHLSCFLAVCKVDVAT